MVSSVFSVSVLQVFTLHPDGEPHLAPHSRLPLPHPPLDLTFDPEGRLWVLMDCDDVPLQVYTHRQDCWEVRRGHRRKHDRCRKADESGGLEEPQTGFFWGGTNTASVTHSFEGGGSCFSAVVWD